jgi:hypothetical protein
MDSGNHIRRNTIKAMFFSSWGLGWLWKITAIYRIAFEEFERLSGRFERPD